MAVPTALRQRSHPGGFCPDGYRVVPYVLLRLTHDNSKLGQCRLTPCPLPYGRLGDTRPYAFVTDAVYPFQAQPLHDGNLTQEAFGPDVYALNNGITNDHHSYATVRQHTLEHLMKR